MMHLNVKHLEPIHIGYTDEAKYALVTEDGSKFYPNDLVYHKSIDVMIQKLDEKDKELVSLWSKAFLQMKRDESDKGIFYLNEKEFNNYCSQSLNFLETSNSQDCRSAKAQMENIHEDQFYDCEKVAVYLNGMLKELKGSDEFKKIWRSRGANGLEGREFVRIITMIKLAEMNVTRGTNVMCNLRRYQCFNTGRKVILRMMCDRRIEDYNEWDMSGQEIAEACSLILLEEGKLASKLAKIHKWNSYHHERNRQFVKVTEFKEFLRELEIDQSRFTLLPDVHFAYQWIHLPLKVDYKCATVLLPDGQECYRPIQAQLHFFERLACDIDWEAASKKHPQKTQQMRSKIIKLLECTHKDKDFYSPDEIEKVINHLESDSFFSESRKRTMKTPLYICRKKNYNDYIPMTEFKKMFKLHYREGKAEDLLSRTDKIEVWKVRYMFLNRWIEIVLRDHKQLSNNLMAAATLQIGFVNLEDEDDLMQYCMGYDPRRFMDYGKFKMFEKMAKNSQLGDAPKQKKPSKKPASSLKRALDKVDEKKTLIKEVEVSPEKMCEVSEKVDEVKECEELPPAVEEVEPEKVDRCQCCDEMKDEIETLKRQLAEKTTLLEDRSKSDGSKIQQLQKEVEEAKKLMGQQKQDAEEMQKSLKEQASKIKQDYKKENQKLKEDSINKEKRIKQLEKELKESRENAKNERKKMNSEADSESKMIDKNMKKMKAELEMAKLTEKTHSKSISNLEKKNSQLQTQIEILEEKLAMAIGSGKDEQLRELTKRLEVLESENSQVSAKNQELGKLALMNDDLMAEIVRLQESLEAATKKKVKDAPFAEQDCPICIDEIENGDKNVSKCETCRAEYHHNCLSEWLNLNPTCPNCRVHWPNPQEFPAL